MHILLVALAYADPGDHIQVGGAAVAPRILVGVDHNTNVFYSDSTPVGGTSLRVVPGLDITSSNDNVDYQLSGEYRFRKFFQADVTRADRFNEFGARATVSVGKQSVVGFQLAEDAGLRNTPTEAPSSDRPFQTQLRQSLDASFVIRPTSAITLRVGGLWSFDDFRVAYSLDNGSFAFNRSNTFGPKGELAWNFFPSTALVVSGAYEMTRWNDNLVDLPSQSTLGSTLAVPNSNQFRLWAGMRGRLTRKVVVQAMVGYGSGNFLEQSVDGTGTVSDAFAADVTGAERVLVDAQVRWAPSETNLLTFGFQRDFRDVFFTNYSQYNYPYVRGNARFGAFGVNGEVGARVEAYRGQITRDDFAPTARLDAGYYLKNWASFTVGSTYTARTSSDTAVGFSDINVHGAVQITY